MLLAKAQGGAVIKLQSGLNDSTISLKGPLEHASLWGCGVYGISPQSEFSNFPLLSITRIRKVKTHIMVQYVSRIPHNENSTVLEIGT
jgi:hypothetical protein